MGAFCLQKVVKILEEVAVSCQMVRCRASLVTDGKESACNAGDPGSIPGSGRSSGETMAIHSSILSWRIPGIEEPDVLQFTGSQRVRQD